MQLSTYGGAASSAPTGSGSLARQKIILKNGVQPYGGTAPRPHHGAGKKSGNPNFGSNPLRNLSPSLRTMVLAVRLTTLIASGLARRKLARMVNKIWRF